MDRKIPPQNPNPSHADPTIPPQSHNPQGKLKPPQQVGRRQCNDKTCKFDREIDDEVAHWKTCASIPRKFLRLSMSTHEEAKREARWGIERLLKSYKVDEIRVALDCFISLWQTAEVAGYTNALNYIETLPDEVLQRMDLGVPIYNFAHEVLSKFRGSVQAATLGIEDAACENLGPEWYRSHLPGRPNTANVNGGRWMQTELDWLQQNAVKYQQDERAIVDFNTIFPSRDPVSISRKIALLRGQDTTEYPRPRKPPADLSTNEQLWLAELARTNGAELDIIARFREKAKVDGWRTRSDEQVLQGLRQTRGQLALTSTQR